MTLYIKFKKYLNLIFLGALAAYACLWTTIRIISESGLKNELNINQEMKDLNKESVLKTCQYAVEDVKGIKFFD